MIEISPKTISTDFIDQLSKTPNMLIQEFLKALWGQTDWYWKNLDLSKHFIAKITGVEEGQKSLECIQLVNKIVLLLLGIKKDKTEESLFDALILAMCYRSEFHCHKCFDCFLKQYNINITHEDFKTIIVEVRYQDSEKLKKIEEILVKLQKNFSLRIVVYTSEPVLEEGNDSLVNFSNNFGDNIYSLALSNYNEKMSTENLEKVFKNCKNLRNLNFAGELETLNNAVSLLTSLETLKLSYNSILKISLKTLNSLRELDLNCCHKLNEIEGLAKAEHLTKIIVMDCPRVDISLWQNFKYLEEIILMGKNTKLVRFINLENLQKIDIHQSDVEILVLENLPKLEMIDFSSQANKLKVNSSGLKSLKDIKLGKVSVEISDVIPLLWQLVENKVNFSEFIKAKKIHIPFYSDHINDIPKLRMMNELNIAQSEMKKSNIRIDNIIGTKNENSKKFIDYLHYSLLAFPALALHLLQHKRNELHQLTDEIDLEYSQAMTILPYLSPSRVQRLISSALLEKAPAKQKIIQFMQFQGNAISVFGEVHNRLKNCPFEETLIISQKLLSLFTFEELAQIFSQLVSKEELFLIDFIPQLTEIQWAVCLPVLGESSFLEALKKIPLIHRVNYLRYSTPDQHALFLQHFSDSNTIDQQRLDGFKDRKEALKDKEEYTTFLNEWRTFYHGINFTITNKLEAYYALAILFIETLTIKEIMRLCPRFFQNARELQAFNQALQETNQVIQVDYEAFDREEEVDNEFICPISMTVMENPVKDPKGRIADLESFSNWLRKMGMNPFDRSELTLEMLQPDENLKKRIGEWKEKKESKKPKKEVKKEKMDDNI